MTCTFSGIVISKCPSRTSMHKMNLSEISTVWPRTMLITITISDWNFNVHYVSESRTVKFGKWIRFYHIFRLLNSSNVMTPHTLTIPLSTLRSATSNINTDDRLRAHPWHQSSTLNSSIHLASSLSTSLIWYKQSKSIQAVTPLNFIWEVPGSNLSRDTDYSDCGCCWFSSFSPHRCRHSTLN
jgi:hypothetical protein